MKIRQGFVSNSSTTSFCIYGAGISHEQEEDAEELGLIVERDEYGDLYAGLYWFNIGDDETGGEFKIKIREKISKLTDKKCRTIEEAYSDR